MKKKGIMDVIIYLIIAVAVLALTIFLYLLLKGKGINAIEFIKNLFRFRGAG